MTRLALRFRQNISYRTAPQDLDYNIGLAGHYLPDCLIDIKSLAVILLTSGQELFITSANLRLCDEAQYIILSRTMYCACSTTFLYSQSCRLK